MIQILFTHHFKKQLKQLIKNDTKLKEKLLRELKNFAPKQRISIGKGIFKLRISGLQKGKSGGYRTYILLMRQENILTPLCIYAKKDQENLKVKELTMHLHAVQEELELLL